MLSKFDWVRTYTLRLGTHLIYKPSQINPSPVQPRLQAHEYDPRLLVQVACSSQLWRLSAHSSTSEELCSKNQVTVLIKWFVFTVGNIFMDVIYGFGGRFASEQQRCLNAFSHANISLKLLFPQFAQCLYQRHICFCRFQ